MFHVSITRCILCKTLHGSITRCILCKTLHGWCIVLLASEVSLVLLFLIALNFAWGAFPSPVCFPSPRLEYELSNNPAKLRDYTFHSCLRFRCRLVPALPRGRPSAAADEDDEDDEDEEDDDSDRDDASAVTPKARVIPRQRSWDTKVHTEF
jgi:hypothetical protein